MASPVIGADYYLFCYFWAQWCLSPMPSSASWLAASCMALTCCLVLTLVNHLSVSLVLASRDPDEAETVAQCTFLTYLGSWVWSPDPMSFRKREALIEIWAQMNTLSDVVSTTASPCLPQTSEELCCQNDLARAPKMQRIPGPRRRVLLESQNKPAHRDSDSMEPSKISWKASWLLCFLTTEGSR